MENYELVIGLEVHVELSTESKLFCGCSTKFGSEPNTQVCPICAGMPGTLPVLNSKAIDLAMKASVAFNCEIFSASIFARKNYFYPDLPKNYQISQYEQPIAADGHFLLEGRKIRIKRMHMEEDAGKLIHSQGQSGYSFIDLNRSGIPLLEIVTEPDIRSSAEAEKFLNSLKQVLEYLEISDCNMEEGSLRCDANISVRSKGESTMGVKAEIKNMNSFKAVRKALDYEANRQVSMLKKDVKVIQETRLWNDEMQVTEGMRSKEEAQDYRYFPDPDLPVVYVSKEMIQKVIQQVMELPQQRKERFIREYGLSDYDASSLTSKKEIADYFEKTVVKVKDPKRAANWIMGELMAMIKETKTEIASLSVTPEYMAQILVLVEEHKITGTTAKQVLYECFKSGKSPDSIVKEKNLIQITDENFIDDIIKKVLQSNLKAVEDYKNGKQQALGYLVGQVMQETKGKANPKIVTENLSKALKRM